jgi:hypothetical protein
MNPEEIKECKGLAGKLQAYHTLLAGDPYTRALSATLLDLFTAKNGFMGSHRDFVIENFNINCKR